MSPHGHGHGHGDRHGHGHAAAFDDERQVRRLEAEARLASGVHGAAVRVCGEHLEGTAARVVDLGCGPGVVSLLLAQRFPSARVLAADGSAAMLARATALTREAGVGDRVETARVDLDGDLGALGPADLVWIAMALHHAADEARTVGAIRSLLRPGGWLCVLERAEPTTVRLPDDLGRPGIWDRLDRAWAGLGSHGADPGRHAALLTAAGLEVVERRVLRDAVSAPDDAETRSFVHDRLSGSARALEGAADPADLDALRARIADEDTPLAAGVTFSRELLLARAPDGIR